MNKGELIEAVANATGSTKADAGRAIDATVDSITGALKKGDTVTIETTEKIRFLGAAAPEISPLECYGNESAAFLEELILNQEVRLQFDVECTDIYQRTLGWVFWEDSDATVVSLMEEYSIPGLQDDGSYILLVNEMLIRLGYAKIFTGDVAKNIRYTERLESAEEYAKEEGLGVWGMCE